MFPLALMTAPLIVRSAEDIRIDRQEVVLMLHDFSFRAPEELLAGLIKSSGSQSAMSKSGMGNSMNMGSGSMAAMNMQSGMEMDLNDIDYDAFLANDRTLGDPEVIRTERGGRVRLRQRCVVDAILDGSRCAQRHRCRRRRPSCSTGARQPSSARHGPAARRAY
jgi:hypothetical protein